MKGLTPRANVVIPRMVVLAMLLHQSIALPSVQKLPSAERPFVYIHIAKTGGSSLREVIVHGARAAGVPSEQLYIPCYEKLECTTSTINTVKPVSVVAGHFAWAELKRVGIQQMDCMVSMRDPIDRATSCLFYYHRDAMTDVARMTEQDFRKVALEDTACNNVAAAMLMSDPPGIDSMAVNRASLNASLSQAIAASALTNLEHCVVINHLDVSHGQIWATWAPMFLTTWFPWVSSKSKGSIPHHNTNDKPYRLPYRLVKVLEDLNSVDTLLYNRATELMLLQLGFARAKGFHTRQEDGAQVESAPSAEPAADPGVAPDLQSRTDSVEGSSSKHGISRRALSAP